MSLRNVTCMYMLLGLTIWNQIAYWCALPFFLGMIEATPRKSQQFCKFFKTLIGKSGHLFRLWLIWGKKKSFTNKQSGWIGGFWIWTHGEMMSETFWVECSLSRKVIEESIDKTWQMGHWSTASNGLFCGQSWVGLHSHAHLFLWGLWPPSHCNSRTE